MGNVPRIELFARERVFGWDALGNEIDGKDIRDAIDEIDKQNDIISLSKKLSGKGVA